MSGNINTNTVHRFKTALNEVYLLATVMMK